MSAQTPRYIRAYECIKPRGPIPKASFYRGVANGDIPLEHIGPRRSVVPFGSVDELQDHLAERERARRAAAEQHEPASE